MTDHKPQEWSSLLSRLNSLLFESDERKRHLRPDVVPAGWCGLPPASEESLAQAEQRLGVRLPPSYRSFLLVANGWLLFDSFIERVLSIGEVDWFRLARPSDLAMIERYYQEDQISDEEYVDYDTNKHMAALRHRYFPDCLLIGIGWPGEGALILLNSKIISSSGEWEAIYFADWFPGNRRYRSFRHLVEATVKDQEHIQKVNRR